MSRLPEDVHMIAKTLVTIRIPNNSIRTAAERVVEAEQLLSDAREHKRQRENHLNAAHASALRINSNPSQLDAQKAAEIFSIAAGAFTSYYAACQRVAALRSDYDFACTALDSLLVTPEERAERRRAASKPTPPKDLF